MDVDEELAKNILWTEERDQKDGSVHITAFLDDEVCTWVRITQDAFMASALLPETIIAGERHKMRHDMLGCWHIREEARKRQADQQFVGVG